MQPQLTNLFHRRRRLLERWPWLAYLAPLLVFMTVGSFEPAAPAADASTPPAAEDRATPGREDAPPGAGPFNLPYAAYPWVYAAKLALTLAAMALVAPVYRQHPRRVQPLALAVGAAGAAAWIGICRLQLEQALLSRAGLGDLLPAGGRSAFNPLVELAGSPPAAFAFLACRLIGLALVVPVIEEFFLRGLVVRWVVDPDRWYKLPVGQVNRLALVVATVAPMAMHPGEFLAAAVWFSAVTWLMVKTKSLWNCVAAHAVTNLLLGIHAVATGDWRLL